MLWYINPAPPLRKVRKVKPSKPRPKKSAKKVVKKAAKRTRAARSDAVLTGSRVTITRGQGGSVHVRVNPKDRSGHMKKRRRMHRNPASIGAFRRAENAAVRQYKKAMRAVGKKPTKSGAAAARAAMRAKIRTGVAKKWPKISIKRGVGVGPMTRRQAAAHARQARAVASYVSGTPRRRRPRRSTGGSTMPRRRTRTRRPRTSPRRRRPVRRARPVRRTRRAPARRVRRVRRINWLKRYQRALHSRRPRGRAARAIRAARITITRSHAGRWRKGKAYARSRVRQLRMQTNPSGTMKAVVATMKQVAPVAVAFLGTRYGTAFLTSKLSGVGALARLGDHLEPAVALALVAGAHVASAKVGPLRKFRTGIMVGAGLNGVMALIKAYAPASVKGYLGVGDADGVYDTALSAYEDVGSACGAYEDLGAVARRAPARRMLSAPRGMARAIPRSSTARQIPEWSDEPLDSFYTGIFSGGYGG